MRPQGARYNPLRDDVAGIAAFLAAGGMCHAPDALRLDYRDALLLSVRLQKRQQDEADAAARALARARGR